MADVFGNRILGGIGAPESRAAETFGTGVTTALQQRTSRQAMDVNAQAMRLREEEAARLKQRFGWDTEDRAANKEAAALLYSGMAGGYTPPQAGVNVGGGLAAPQLAFGGGYGPASTGALPSGNALSFGLTKHFEGFSSSPYWDVNAYRGGFGSDTVTLSDGSVVKVKPGMTITEEDAQRDFDRRMNTEFVPRAAKQVGEQVWAAFPAHVTEALASVAYNYGSLPGNVVEAAKTGNPELIAQAIEARAGDNGGINAKRRMQEAAIVRNGGAIDPGLMYAAAAPTGAAGGSYIPDQSQRYAPMPRQPDQSQRFAPMPLKPDQSQRFAPMDYVNALRGDTQSTDTPAIDTTVTEVDPNAPQFTQDVQGFMRSGDISGAINRIGDELATGGYGPMGSPLGSIMGYFTDTPTDISRRTAVSNALDWFRGPEAKALFTANPQLLTQAAQDPITFAQRYIRTVSTTPATTAPTTAPATTAPATTTPATTAPAQAGLSFGSTTPAGELPPTPNTTTPATTAPATTTPATTAPATTAPTQAGLSFGTIGVDTTQEYPLGVTAGVSEPSPQTADVKAGATIETVGSEFPGLRALFLDAPMAANARADLMAQRTALLRQAKAASIRRDFATLGTIGGQVDILNVRLNKMDAVDAANTAAMTGNFAPLAAATSAMSGMDVKIVETDKGKYNVIVNGTVNQSDVPAADILKNFMYAVNDTYRAEVDAAKAAAAEATVKQAEYAAEQAKVALEAELKYAGEKKIEEIKAMYAAQLAAQNPDLATSSITLPDQSSALMVFSKKNQNTPLTIVQFQTNSDGTIEPVQVPVASLLRGNQ